MADSLLALPSALDTAELMDELGSRPFAVFLDYDGTLTPIVDRPEHAVLSADTRRVLADLAEVVPVGIISGRDLDDVRRAAGVEGLWYAGSHGFDVAAPDGARRQFEQGVAALPALERAELELRRVVPEVEGAWVERKRFALAVHFRAADPADEPRLARLVDHVARSHSHLRLTGGKKILELRPDVDWDKGRALEWMVTNISTDISGSGPPVLPVYVGDDETDEDAFRVARRIGLGVVVGDEDRPTAASHRLVDTCEVARFLECLATLGRR